MKKVISIKILFLYSLFNFAQSPSVQSVIDQVNIDSLTYLVRQLSGEVPVIISGVTDTIKSRHKLQPGNDKAANFIKQKLESYGLNVYDQIFSSTGKNVYAVQTGTKYPNQKYIICAHYDDMPSGTIAPGADDNASGTAAVIEAARILSNYTFPFTIIYALWDEEEQGLVGSNYYANDARGKNDSILGVINLDMIAYDSDNDGMTEIHTNEFESSQDLKNKMIDIRNIYQLNLDFNVIDPGKPWSDHKSFWDKNYGAILLIEDYNDFNLFYHKVTDKISEFNLTYFHEMSRLAIATFTLFSSDYNIFIKHLPIASTNQTNDIQTSAIIYTSMKVGTGSNSPRLYYRTKNTADWSEFLEVVGQLSAGDTLYNFTIPGQELGTIIQYYIAVQDEDSNFVTTLPNGGYGFSPPGNIKPNKFFEFYIGSENVVYSDSFNNLVNWTPSGQWGLATNKFVSSLYSLTDSPSGNYLPSTNSYCLLKDTFNLDIENCFKVLLEFQTQWVIEEDWDYGQLLISSDGGNNWIPQEGLYTNLGTGSTQPIDQPLYDGGRYNWVKETIDLSNFIGQKINLKFTLKSDDYIQFDGWYIDDIKVTAYTSTASSIKDFDILPNEYALEQNYPNPFNPTTKIRYSIPSDITGQMSKVQLKVYDILGQEVRTLVNEEKSPGVYEIEFDASNLASGIYIYRLTAGKFSDVKKMILLR